LRASPHVSIFLFTFSFLLLSSPPILFFSSHILNTPIKMASVIKDAVSNVLGKLQGTTPEAPREPSVEEFQTLQKKYTDAGQGHVFAFVDELTTVEKSRLFHQLSNFDPTRINELADKALNPPPVSEGTVTLEPLPEVATASILDSDPSDIQKWYEAGLKEVAANKVAVVLMAGGQGTRLGSSAPKGCFDIGLLSEKSLFQLQAQRIAKLQSLIGGKDVVIPWYIMTSGPTRKPTEEFFEKNNYFGLDKSNVMIFEQGILPCISNDGKILLENKSKVRNIYGCSSNRYRKKFVDPEYRLPWLLMETAASTRASWFPVCGRTCVAVASSTSTSTEWTTALSR
jgi:UDP-N-acetylglucosamine/UDP-N-acetylgalactosamine diphosphorylase